MILIGELVKKKNRKMPYSKIPEYGIAFIGLPPHLEQDIGSTPRKPALYGSAQRRELWQSRDVWSLTNNLPTNLPADVSPSAIEPVSGLVSSSLHSSSSILHSSSDSVTNPLTSNPVVSSSLNSSASILNHSTPNTSISTFSDSLNSSSLSTASVSDPFTSNFIASNSLDFSSSMSNPSTSTPPVFTSSALQHSTPAFNPPISVTHGNLFNSRPSFSKSSAFIPRTSGSFTSASFTSASSLLVSNALKPVSFSPGQAASSPATLASLHAIHKTNAIRVPKGTVISTYY